MASTLPFGEDTTMLITIGVGILSASGIVYVALQKPHGAGRAALAIAPGVLLFVLTRALLPALLSMLAVEVLQLFEMWRHRRRSDAELVRALKDQNPATCMKAMVELRKVPGKRRKKNAVAAIYELLGHNDKKVRREALSSITALTEGSDDLIGALAVCDPLLRAEVVRMVGARTLTARGEPAGLDALVRSLSDDDRAVRTEAVKALAGISHLKLKAEGALMSMLDSHDSNTRRLVAEVVADLPGQLAVSRAVASKLQLLSEADADEGVRREAAKFVLKSAKRENAGEVDRALDRSQSTGWESPADPERDHKKMSELIISLRWNIMPSVAYLLLSSATKQVLEGQPRTSSRSHSVLTSERAEWKHASQLHETVLRNVRSMVDDVPLGDLTSAVDKAWTLYSEVHTQGEFVQTIVICAHMIKDQSPGFLAQLGMTMQGLAKESTFRRLEKGGAIKLCHAIWTGTLGSG